MYKCEHHSSIIYDTLKMERLYLLMMCRLIIFESIHADSTYIPEVVNFSVFTEQGEEVEVNLIPIETFLANENVPVWIPNPEYPSELIVIKDVMNELAPFTVYRDPLNCAAALYYHKRKQFDGTIGHHHIIHNLKYNPVTKHVEPTKDSIFVSPLEKHDENRLAENEDVIEKKGGNIMRKWNKSLQKYPDTVYIETLVIVDYDVAEELEFDYTKIVSHILTLFNSVDMIFSTIEEPKIKINIAGIIIRTTRVSFPRLILNSCYDRSPYDNRVVVMDALCAVDAIRLTLDEYRTLPAQSYDIIVFFTKYPMFRKISINSDAKVCVTKKLPLLGLAVLPRVGHDYRLSPDDTRAAIIRNPDIFKLLPSTAHELAHLLGVPHDEGPLWVEDGTCDAHLMKKDNTYCKKCLKFGGMTPKYLREFFGSRDACIFYNKPRSLNNPPGPRSFWNEDEQCECYGYKAAHKPPNTLRNSIEQWLWPAVDCKTRLKCVNENNQVDDTGYYMDGTPCDKNKIGSKVCWNNKCTSIWKDSSCVLRDQ